MAFRLDGGGILCGEWKQGFPQSTGTRSYLLYHTDHKWRLTWAYRLNFVRAHKRVFFCSLNILLKIKRTRVHEAHKFDRNPRKSTTGAALAAVIKKHQRLNQLLKASLCLGISSNQSEVIGGNHDEGHRLNLLTAIHGGRTNSYKQFYGRFEGVRAPRGRLCHLLVCQSRAEDDSD